MRGESVLEKLSQLSALCEKKDIEHRVVTYEGEYKSELGTLEDNGIWIGPSVYFSADWDEHELVINANEVLLDGNDLEYSKNV